MKRWKKAGSIVALLISLAVGITGCQKATDTGKGLEELDKGNLSVGVSVHDPSIVKDSGQYYIFGSHMEAAQSSDLIAWKSFASGVNAANPLFDNLFSEDMEAFSFVGEYIDGGYAVWAPSVIYNETMGKWMMYFSTSHDYITSNICFAVADEVTGPYSYVDSVLFSGFTSLTVDKTNFYKIMGEDASVSAYLSSAKYNNLNYPNCIDPSVFYDEDGKLWMVYGSWSGGIWLLEIDKETGYPIHPEVDEEKHIDAYYGKYLIGGLHNSCEGPFILYDKEAGMYYLFVSFGSLTSEGGYQIRQFRSETVDGPYVDASGNSLGYVAQHSSYGLKMIGNYMLPSLKTAYMAPGHNSALIDDNGKKYLVYHQRFDDGSEYHEPRIHQLFTNKDGWLVAAPFATMGESLKAGGYQSDEEVAGLYYTVNHGTDIGPEIHSWDDWELRENGKIYIDEKEAGSYELEEGSCFLTLQVNGQCFNGVIVEMEDETGNPVRCITAAGDNNETVWGIYYKN